MANLQEYNFCLPTRPHFSSYTTLTSHRDFRGNFPAYLMPAYTEIIAACIEHAMVVQASFVRCVIM